MGRGRLLEYHFLGCGCLLFLTPLVISKVTRERIQSVENMKAKHIEAGALHALCPQ
jgi:hypothetical protein